MAFDQTFAVWFNGEMMRWTEANVPVTTHGLHYGTGVFEGIRCYNTADGPAVFRLTPHLARFYSSAQTYHLNIPYTTEELTEAIDETIRRNDFRDCYVRPICFSGGESLGIRARNSVNVAIIAWAWANEHGHAANVRGVRATISPWRKFHHSMMPTTAKASGQYLNSRLAVEEAARRGFDEALLLNAEGDLAEGAVENIFLIRGGVLYTNDERSSILLGVTRSTVIDLAGELGLPVEITTLKAEDLFAADEAFLTGTAAEIVGIREVDGKIIGGVGETGPVTRRIQKLFRECVEGRHPRRASWLHHVNPQIERRDEREEVTVGV